MRPAVKPVAARHSGGGRSVRVSFMAEVIIKDLKKVYDNDVVAVHDVNLHIKDKEFIVLVGPSGCGKSTTLRMVAGLEDISGGELYIDGHLVNDIAPKDRDIAMVFQSYALYPHMNVYDNMAFALALRRVPQDQIDKKVREVAEILGITQYLERKPKALSGGQRQRVAIGRAMVRDPKVFLMDEPLSNLDAKLRNQMRAEIILLRKRVDTTFVYVTHDQTEAMTLGDRIVIMKDGYIQQVGTPQEVFDTPVNLFVAGFIGSPQMNFLKANLVKGSGSSYSVELLGSTIPLNDEQNTILAKKGVGSQEIILGVRPEHTSVLFDNNDSAIECTINVNEMMGSELHLHLSSKNDDKIIVRLPTVDLTKEQRDSLSYGNKLYITFPAKVMHLFDPETEKSLIDS